MSAIVVLLLQAWPVWADVPKPGGGGDPESDSPAAKEEAVERGEEEPISAGLERVADGMRKVEDGLVRKALDETLVEQERKILEELDRLIEKTSEDQGGSGGGDSNKQQQQKEKNEQKQTDPRKQPASREDSKQEQSEQESSSQSGGGGRGRGGDSSTGPGVRPESVPWGDLPYREREKIFQGIKGDFPVRYRRLLESYYRELAK